MIELNYIGVNNKIKAAVLYTNYLFIYPPFLKAVCDNKYFDMADISPVHIAALLRYSKISISVDEYFSLSPSVKTYTYDDPQDKNKIHLNRRALSRPLHSICNTLMHQCVHAVDAFYSEYCFGHGDDNPLGKENTAPFRIAHIAQKIVANNNKVFETMIHEETNNIPEIQVTSMTDIQEMLCEEGITCFYDHLMIMGGQEA